MRKNKTMGRVPALCFELDMARTTGDEEGVAVLSKTLEHSYSTANAVRVTSSYDEQ